MLYQPSISPKNQNIGNKQKIVTNNKFSLYHQHGQNHIQYISPQQHPYNHLTYNQQIEASIKQNLTKLINQKDYIKKLMINCILSNLYIEQYNYQQSYKILIEMQKTIEKIQQLYSKSSKVSSKDKSKNKNNANIQQNNVFQLNVIKIKMYTNFIIIQIINLQADSVYEHVEKTLGVVLSCESKIEDGLDNEDEQMENYNPNVSSKYYHRQKSLDTMMLLFKLFLKGLSGFESFEQIHAQALIAQCNLQKPASINQFFYFSNISFLKLLASSDHEAAYKLQSKSYQIIENQIYETSRKDKQAITLRQVILKTISLKKLIYLAQQLELPNQIIKKYKEELNSSQGLKSKYLNGLQQMTIFRNYNQKIDIGYRVIQKVKQFQKDVILNILFQKQQLTNKISSLNSLNNKNINSKTVLQSNSSRLSVWQYKALKNKFLQILSSKRVQKDSSTKHNIISMIQCVSRFIQVQTNKSSKNQSKLAVEETIMMEKISQMKLNDGRERDGGNVGLVNQNKNSSLYQNAVKQYKSRLDIFVGAIVNSGINELLTQSFQSIYQRSCTVEKEIKKIKQKQAWQRQSQPQEQQQSGSESQPSIYLQDVEVQFVDQSKSRQQNHQVYNNKSRHNNDNSKQIEHNRTSKSQQTQQNQPVSIKNIQISKNSRSTNKDQQNHNTVGMNSNNQFQQKQKYQHQTIKYSPSPQQINKKNQKIQLNNNFNNHYHYNHETNRDNYNYKVNYDKYNNFSEQNYKKQGYNQNNLLEISYNNNARNVRKQQRKSPKQNIFLSDKNQTFVDYAELGSRVKLNQNKSISPTNQDKVKQNQQFTNQFIINQNPKKLLNEPSSKPKDLQNYVKKPHTLQSITKQQGQIERPNEQSIVRFIGKCSHFDYGNSKQMGQMGQNAYHHNDNGKKRVFQQSQQKQKHNKNKNSTLNNQSNAIPYPVSLLGQISMKKPQVNEIYKNKTQIFQKLNYQSDKNDLTLHNNFTRYKQKQKQKLRQKQIKQKYYELNLSQENQTNKSRSARKTSSLSPKLPKDSTIKSQINEHIKKHQLTYSPSSINKSQLKQYKYEENEKSQYSDHGNVESKRKNKSKVEKAVTISKIQNQSKESQNNKSSSKFQNKTIKYKQYVEGLQKSGIKVNDDASILKKKPKFESNSYANGSNHRRIATQAYEIGFNEKHQFQFGELKENSNQDSAKNILQYFLKSPKQNGAGSQSQQNISKGSSPQKQKPQQIKSPEITKFSKQQQVEKLKQTKSLAKNQSQKSHLPPLPITQNLQQLNKKQSKQSINSKVPNFQSNNSNANLLNIQGIIDYSMKLKKAHKQKLKEITRLCQNGQYVQKRHYTSDGGQERFLKLSNDHKFLQWAATEQKLLSGNKKQYEIKNIRGIVFGKVTDTMNKHYNKNLEPYKCISFIFQKRTFDIYIPDMQDAKFWLPGISYAISQVRPQLNHPNYTTKIQKFIKTKKNAGNSSSNHGEKADKGKREEERGQKGQRREIEERAEKTQRDQIRANSAYYSLGRVLWKRALLRMQHQYLTQKVKRPYINKNAGAIIQFRNALMKKALKSQASQKQKSISQVSRMKH